MDDMYGEEDSVADGVPIWSALDAGTLGSTKGPIHDKSALQKVMQAEAPATDAYGMPVAGDQEEMMSALGLV
jgi:hypothetical protein